ncbi:ParB/RepB/Spo0J family partition protein [Kineococcus indalonis]|uniref:ParB/RepB/Spo0J family partition protein n=1 Tax=Kineococcus indalonis TaxID=2696566 RepID=UPI001412C30C|nr:ParB/RepB/Spo0J family partition protein [Kineococcus indalonis]NAZ84637.1 ParB/RepB/Spo0J family partition protein [Kineococcus indalonis]
MTSTTEPTTAEATSEASSEASTHASGTAVSSDAQPATTLVQLNPADLIIGDNVRVDTRVDADFLASIKERGVLQPIVAVRHPDGTHVVRYGQRRTLAATQVKRPTVPVLVVAATDEADQIIDQMAENDHRTALTERERLAGITRLFDLGMSAAQIAKQTATDREQVAAARKVAKSATATQVLAQVPMTFTEAAVLVEFEDTPADVQAMLAKVGTSQFEHLAQRLRDQRAERARHAAYAKKLREAGHTVLDERPGYGEVAQPFDSLRLNGEPIPAEVRATCPDLALWITERRGWGDPVTGEGVEELNSGAAMSGGVPAGWREADEHWKPVVRPEPAEVADQAADEGEDAEGDGDEYDEDDEDEAEHENRADRLVHEDGRRAELGYCLRTEQWCMKPHVYGYAKPSYSGGYYVGGGAPKVKMAELPPVEQAKRKAERRDVIESNKAWVSAEKVRQAWLWTFLGRKSAPKGTGRFLAEVLLSGSMRESTYTAIDKAVSYLGKKDTRTALAEAGTVTDGRGTVLALAVVLAAHESATGKHSWRTVNPHTRRYLEFLASCGYVLSDVERRACGHDLSPTEAEQDAEQDEAGDDETAQDDEQD